MNTYYIVTSTFFDDGHSAIKQAGCVQAEKKPESAFKSSSRADYYVDYFDSAEEAINFVNSQKSVTIQDAYR